ncbi:MAG: hypothetical protein ACF8GE_03045 [Phycisphaerales bacterium JB043]
MTSTDSYFEVTRQARVVTGWYIQWSVSAATIVISLFALMFTQASIYHLMLLYFVGSAIGSCLAGSLYKTIADCMRGSYVVPIPFIVVAILGVWIQQRFGVVFLVSILLALFSFGVCVIAALLVSKMRKEPVPSSCSACGYSLEGLQSDVCPECGVMFSNDE